MQNFYDGSYSLTKEDEAVLWRALSRGMSSVMTLVPMMRDEAADAYVMDEHEYNKMLDTEWEAYMAEEAAWLEHCQENGLCDYTGKPLAECECQHS